MLPCCCVFFITHPDAIYVQVLCFLHIQMPNKGHACWERPETRGHGHSKKCFQIDINTPSSDVAAALAAASVVFRKKRPLLFQASHQESY